MARTRPRIGHRMRVNATMLGAFALILPAGTTTASAQRWVGHDPAHDVMRYWQDPEPEPCGTPRTIVRPGNAHNDIRRVVVDHRGRTVEIKVFFESLRPRGGHVRAWADEANPFGPYGPRVNRGARP